MIEFWIKRTQGTSFTIDDLGVTIAATSELDLLTERSEVAISQSADLASALSSSDLVRLDGSGGSQTGDLTTDVVRDKHHYSSVYDIGSMGAAKTIDWNNGECQKGTLTANCTVSFTDLPGPGDITLLLYQDGTGSRTVTWPASAKWPGGTAPTLTTTASAVDIVRLFFDGTNYFCRFSGDMK